MQSSIENVESYEQKENANRSLQKEKRDDMNHLNKRTDAIPGILIRKSLIHSKQSL